MINKLSRLFEKSVKIAMYILFLVLIADITGIYILDTIQTAFVVGASLGLWLLRIEITVDKVNEKLDRKTRISYTYTDEHGKEKTVSYLIK
ncbi:hypothetical protein [Pasteurella canis]|uniref:hypothetical protein n=1 Tax=Pasteurella canis TaxID=753 RepID=UPI00061A59D4|nr:hypothetical protein [Pasteurella canis]AKD38114.1 hypothetical protein I926_03940 [Pasteurella multocida subsp. multocida OH4807]MXN88549.1 hypothetical protein [Pasteurella canis]